MIRRKTSLPCQLFYEPIDCNRIAASHAAAALVRSATAGTSHAAVCVTRALARRWRSTRGEQPHNVRGQASFHNFLPQALDALFEVLLAEPDADARAAAHDAWRVTVDARLAAAAITVKDGGPSPLVPFSAEDLTALCDKFFEEPTPMSVVDIHHHRLAVQHQSPVVRVLAA